MIQRFIMLPTTHVARINYAKSVLALLCIATPIVSQAIPQGFGQFTVNSTSATSTSGTYKTTNNDTGSFTLTRTEARGYTGTVGFTPSSGAMINGIEAKNNAATGVGQDNDRFKYTFTITPDNRDAIHTIKIGQATYDNSGGNSEIARQTLEYSQNGQVRVPAEATIKSNPSVPYFYNGMGDYFMGRLSTTNPNTQLNSNVATSGAQLRRNDSATNDLYYYNIYELSGTSNGANNNPYTPSKNSSGEVSLKRNFGTLPDKPTFANILKTSRDPSSYPVLNSITNNSTYVSYGIGNSDSNYVIAVKNATSVTLTYEGIMKGNTGIDRANVIGETYNEWISFGVESEPYYRFSGIVFNDNGGMNDTNDANAMDADINKVPYNNPNYFNGVFTSPEVGIAGSTVSLVNCANTSTVYASQAVTASGPDIGQYNFAVLPTTLNGNTNLCILEERSVPNEPTEKAYSIRTTTNKIDVGFTTATYEYSGKDFGRVIPANAALVLEKKQVANDCNILDSAGLVSLTYSKEPLSNSGPNPDVNVNPGQCIAYKITATNRAHLGITDFVMTDPLPALSKIAAPARADNIYSDGLTEGSTGIVQTISQSLKPSSKTSFYFNTRYSN